MMTTTKTVMMIVVMMVMVRICGPSNMVGATQHEGGSEVTQVSAGDNVDKDDDLEGEVDHEGGVDEDEEGNWGQMQTMIADSVTPFYFHFL